MMGFLAQTKRGTAWRGGNQAAEAATSCVAALDAASSHVLTRKVRVSA